MTVALEDIPDAWALYSKGRVYINIAMLKHRELIASGYIDYEFKKMKETPREIHKVGRIDSEDNGHLLSIVEYGSSMGQRNNKKRGPV
ncbi:hypothetical protein EVAR_40858_1 [Eumeta japonica]|uniref:Uncharacterized protein n=1 Tax=Eumeta variegata TaxID=151549 RepID=A0A4C1X8J0_EUMVA|nr:hypothetical protein EVAR_40858_1 [Eumeta japonica]